MNDFRQCRLLFRLRVVDQIPEPLSAAAELGTLVHAVLDGLFDLPAAGRTREAAHAAVWPTWDKLILERPERHTLHPTPDGLATWLKGASARIDTYFTLENPQRLEPDARELLLEWQLPDGPLLRGIIDRLDVAPDGSIRVIDYKTGKAPAPQYGQQAKTQMRFYTLLVARSRGRLPSVLQLLYLADGGTVDWRPSETDLDAIEHDLREEWDAIVATARDSAWVPHRSRLCAWCSFQSLCPEFGHTPPELDPAAVTKALGISASPSS
jgi:putative RecB family exonuclease